LNLSEEIEQADALFDGLLGAASAKPSVTTVSITMNKAGKTAVDGCVIDVSFDRSCCDKKLSPSQRPARTGLAA
jgi:hypothetical protein